MRAPSVEELEGWILNASDIAKRYLFPPPPQKKSGPVRYCIDSEWDSYPGCMSGNKLLIWVNKPIKVAHMMCSIWLKSNSETCKAITILNEHVFIRCLNCSAWMLKELPLIIQDFAHSNTDSAHHGTLGQSIIAKGSCFALHCFRLQGTNLTSDISFHPLLELTWQALQVFQSVACLETTTSRWAWSTWLHKGPSFMIHDDL